MWPNLFTYHAPRDNVAEPFGNKVRDLVYLDELCANLGQLVGGHRKPWFPIGVSNVSGSPAVAAAGGSSAGMQTVRIAKVFVPPTF